MIKTIIVVCGTVILLPAIANAQTSEDSNAQSYAYHSVQPPERALGYLNELNINAVRHFNANFKNAPGERWTKKEDGFRASFEKDSIKYLVDYDKQGNWRSTIRIYGEHLLPSDVRRNIKTTFFDYNIVTVSELKINKVLSYFVKLEDQNTLKTVRVINNEMEVVEDYIK